jgi:hypothetical protein
MPSTTDAVLPLFQASPNVDTSGSGSSESSDSGDEAEQPPAKGLGKGVMVAVNGNGVASRVVEDARAEADSTETAGVEAGGTDAENKNTKGVGVNDSKAVPAKSGVKGTSAKAAVTEPASVKGGGKGGGGKADKAASANASASKTNKSISTKATGFKGGGIEDNKTGVDGLLEVFYPVGNSTAKEGDASANSADEVVDKKGDEGQCDNEDDDEEDDEDEDEDDDDDKDEQNVQEMKIAEAKKQLSLDNVDKVVGTSKKTRGKSAAAQEHAVAESGKGKNSANKTLSTGAVRGAITTSTAGVHGKSRI